jgi:hypothetical protein
MDICITSQEPKQLFGDNPQGDELRRDEGEAPRQVKAHLVSEQAPRPRSSAVGLVSAFYEDAFK